MSHFLVYGIGDDIDSQMDRFSEDLDIAREGGAELEFEIEVDKDDVEEYCLKELDELEAEIETKDKQWFESGSANYIMKCLEALRISDYDAFLEFKGYRKNEDGDWGYYYNHDSFWDWYSIGGRWRGAFKLKEGAKGELGSAFEWDKSEVRPGYVDIALKGNIDVHGMIKKAAEDAGALYDKVNKIPKTAKTFEKISEEQNGDMTKARELYNAQPAIKEFQKLGLWGVDFEDFNVSREEYVEKHKFDSFVPFGIVKDGEYYSNGDMGWFGMASNERDTWNEEFMKIWHTIQDDEKVTALDCHV